MTIQLACVGGCGAWGTRANLITRYAHTHTQTHTHTHRHTHTHTHTHTPTHKRAEILPLRGYKFNCTNESVTGSTQWNKLTQTSYEGISGTILNESSVIVPVGFFDFPLSPRRAIRVLLSRVNLKRVLRWFMTWEYSSLVLREIS